MLWLARTAQRGRLQAALVAAASTGLIMVVGCAVVALTALRQSPSEFFWVMSIGAIALALLLAPGLGPDMAIVVVAMVVLGFWLPTGLVAMVLRYAKSLPVAMLAIAAMAVGLLLLAHVLTGDPAAAWIRMVDLTAEEVRTQGGMSEEVLDALRDGAPGITGTIISGWMTLLVLALLLGRYWQAGLDQPGAFGKEFRALQFGPALAIAAVGLVFGALIADIAWLTTLSLIASTLFVFQGLAVIHMVASKRGIRHGWLVGFYVLLLVSPILSICALLGVVDSWVDVRGRLAA